MTHPHAAAVAVFRGEYERINRDEYSGALPPFPGVTLTDRTDLFSATNTTGRGAWRRLQPFLLSIHLRGDLLIEAARHEIAHAAALLFDEDEGHGPAWQAHARRCGARGDVTLDSGHELRATWVVP